MSNLVENILLGNLAEANELFEARIDEIRECKLYESKRQLQAEVFGGLSLQDIADRKKAGYRKASEVLGDPRAKDKKSDARKKLEKLKSQREKKIAEATEKSTAGIRGQIQSKDPEVAQAAAKKARMYRVFGIGLQKLGGRKGLGGKKAPAVKFMPKPTASAAPKVEPETPAVKVKDKKPKKVKNTDNTNRPAAPGSGVLKVASLVGKGVKKVGGAILSDLAGSLPE